MPPCWRWSRGVLIACFSAAFVGSMCIDKSVIRRQASDLRKKTAPLSQKWYRNKQQHVSSAQKLAIREHWGLYGIDLKYGIKVNFTEVFGLQMGKSYFVLDIGFGMGDSLVGMAKQRPECAFIGCEIHRSGIGSALQKVIEVDSITNDFTRNVRIIRSDATILIDNHIYPNSLDEICVFFPDPWPNLDRDADRRVIRPSMIESFERLLKIGGKLRVATDVDEYAMYTRALMEDYEKKGRWVCDSFSEHAPCEGPPDRPVTKYESRALTLGHRMWDMTYLRL